MDENFILLKNTGDYFFANENYEESAKFYERSMVYFDSPNSQLNAALAYYKLSEKIEGKRKLYLKKSLNILNKLAGKWDNPLVNYYRGIVLSLLGKYEEARKDFEFVVENYVDFQKLLLNIDLSLSKELPKTNDDYVYDYLYNKDLIKLFKILSDYSIGERRERILKYKYSEEDVEMAKAREIKRIYNKVETSDLKKFLFSEVALNQAVALLYIWGESEKTYKKIKENSLGFFIDSRKFTPLTASILDKISGINIKKKGIPFFILNELMDVKKLIEVLRMFEKGQYSVEDAMAFLIEFCSKKGIEIPPIEKERIYRDEFYEIFLRALEDYLENVRRKAHSYYSKSETNSMLKAIIQSLPLNKNKKSEFMKYFIDE